MEYIYILQCKDTSLYTGITVDLPRRMRQHCGLIPGGAKYTRSHPPHALAAVWQTTDHTAAARLEAACKQLNRTQKLQLIQAPEQWQLFFPHLDCFEYLAVPFLPLKDYRSPHHT